MKLAHGLALGWFVSAAVVGCARGGADDEAGGGDAGAAAPTDASVDEAAAPADVSTEPDASALLDGNGLPEAMPDAPDEPDVADVETEEAGFCMGTGPLVEVGDTRTQQPTCTGTIAAAVFRNALCTCGDANFGGYLKTRGFTSATPAMPDAGAPDAASDADAAPSEAGDATDASDADDATDADDASDAAIADAEAGAPQGPIAAPVGINGTYRSGGYSDIGGAFEIAGAQPPIFVGYMKVADDFRLNGGYNAIGKTDVAGDMYLHGGLLSAGPVDVAGAYYYDTFSLFTLVVSANKGVFQQQNVTSTPACDCDPTHIVDVGAIVQQGKQSNDNAVVGLDPAQFASIVGQDDYTLPCGRYFLTAIKTASLGSLTLHLQGRTALFVEGDVSMVGSISFDLAPGAELDMFVEGGLNLAGKARFGGDPSRPAATRVYVGGTSGIQLGYSQFVGNLYAPRADFLPVGYVQVFGSLFVNSYTSGSYTDILYDAAVKNAGMDCPAPPPPPGQCTQCGSCVNGQACVAGTCGPCTSDSDCCGLEHCNAGVCLDGVH